MPAIFISYRRNDHAAAVYRLAEWLRRELGAENVYVDIDSIQPGDDFRQHIINSIKQCDVMLVVIGPDWIGNQQQPRRLDDPNDFVRIEVETALNKPGMNIIPVLMARQVMPKSGELPKPLKNLAYKQAVELDPGVDFPIHAERLCQSLRTKPLTSAKSPMNRLLIALLAVVAVGGIATVMYLFLAEPKTKVNTTTQGDQSPIIQGNNNIVNTGDTKTTKKLVDTNKTIIEQLNQADIDRKNALREQQEREAAKRKKELEDEIEAKRQAAIKEKQRYEAAIREDVNAILAVANLNMRDPVTLERMAGVMERTSPQGGGRSYASLGVLYSRLNEPAKAKAHFEKAATFYGQVKNNDMVKWLNEQISGLGK